MKFLHQDRQRHVPAELDVHLICDNYATHKTPAIQQLAGRATPASTCTSPRPARPGSTRSNAGSPSSPTEAPPRHPQQRPRLENDIRAWIDAWNDDPKPFVWTKTADEILENLAAILQRINDSGH